MSAPGESSPEKREKTERELGQDLRIVFASGDSLSHSDVRAIVAGEIRAAHGDFVTRAELRQIVNDAIRNLKENTPTKESVARADTKAGLALAGVVAVFVAIIGAAVFVVRKGFFGE